MSLNVALNAAMTALLVTQKQMSVASNNISNADVTGYTAKTIDVTTQTLDGAGTGVTAGTVTSSVVDRALERDIVAASTEAGYADTTSSYLAVLQDYFGDISSSSATASTSDLASALSTLESGLSTLASSPSSTTDRSQVVSDLDTVTTMLRSLSSDVQQQRATADSDIASSVTSINSDLTTIGDLNTEIRTAKAAGQSTADLEDKRTQALEDLSSYMNVSYFTDGSGNLQVYSGGGQVLVSAGSVHGLSYTAASSVSSSTVYSSSGGGGFSGITVNGVDITSQISSGTLKALIDQRDTVLPQVQSELDTLASTLISTVNTVYNQATSDPAPTSLAGTVSVSSGATFAGTGTVRIAVVDSSGDLVDYQDLNLASYSSVSAVLGAISSISGVTASLNSSGDLVIASTISGDGVAINEMSSSVGSASEGFSDYFGLNDLLTGSTAGTIAVRSDLLDTASGLATGTLSDAATLTAGMAVITSGDSTIATGLYDALTATTSFSASGALGATSASFSAYAGDIISDVASRYATAESAAGTKDTMLTTLKTDYSNETGVNTDTETAKIEALQSEYAAAAKVVSAVQSMFQTLLDAVSA